MGNRSVFNIMKRNGEGIRGFDTNNNVAPGWFLLLDPPKGTLDFSYDHDEEEEEEEYPIIKAFREYCQSDGRNVIRNWSSLLKLAGQDEILDVLLEACRPLFEPVERLGPDIVYSCDIGEYLMFGEEEALKIVRDWKGLHQAIRAGSAERLRERLLAMLEDQWPLEGLTGVNSVLQMEELTTRTDLGSEKTPWSVVMCGWASDVCWETLMGWGTGVPTDEEQKES